MLLEIGLIIAGVCLLLILLVASLYQIHRIKKKGGETQQPEESPPESSDYYTDIEMNIRNSHHGEKFKSLRTC